MPHISNRRKGNPNSDKVKRQEIHQNLLKDGNIRSLDEDKMKTAIKHLNEAVIWLLEQHQRKD